MKAQLLRGRLTGRPLVEDRRNDDVAVQPEVHTTGPVLRRAARLLSAFSYDHPTLTLSELSRRAELPLTTAHRLTAELVACRFLERDDNDRYHIGIKLWEIAVLVPQRRTLRDIALPFMEDLYQITAQHVQLAVREGEEAVFIERISGHDVVPVLSRIGSRFPLHSTGVGRVLLAFAPHDIQEKVLASPIQQLSPHTVTSPADLRRILADVRALGFAVNDRQVCAETFSVAAPIRGPAGEVVAALAIVVASEQHASVQSLAPVVQATARAVSRSLPQRD